MKITLISAPIVLGLMIWQITNNLLAGILCAVVLEVAAVLILKAVAKKKPLGGVPSNNPLLNCSKEELMHIAKTAPDRVLRSKAAVLLDNTEVWKDMILHDEENFATAVHLCSDYPFLKSLYETEENAWKKSNLLDRLTGYAEQEASQYIDACDDENELLTIVLTRHIPTRSEESLGVLGTERMVTTAMAKIAEPAVLVKIAVQAASDKTAMAAVKRLSASDSLTKVVMQAQSYYGVVEALKRMHDPDVLQNIVEHSPSENIRKKAKIRICEENSSRLCDGNHAWKVFKTETDDNGSGPKYSWKWEKCQRCGFIMKSTHVDGKFAGNDFFYIIDGVEEKL